MKKLYVLVMLLAAFIVMGASVFSIQGTPVSNTYTLTGDNAVTLQAAWEAAGGTWLSTGPPIAVTLQTETNGARLGCGGDTPTVDNVGTVFTAGTSGRFAHPAAASSMKICPSTTGANPKIHMILEY